MFVLKVKFYVSYQNLTKEIWCIYYKGVHNNDINKAVNTDCILQLNSLYMADDFRPEKNLIVFYSTSRTFILELKTHGTLVLLCVHKLSWRTGNMNRNLKTSNTGILNGNPMSCKTACFTSLFTYLMPWNQSDSSRPCQGWTRR